MIDNMYSHWSITSSSNTVQNIETKTQMFRPKQQQRFEKQKDVSYERQLRYWYIYGQIQLRNENPKVASREVHMHIYEITSLFCPHMTHVFIMP